MYKKIVYTCLLSLALVFSACGSNEKEDGLTGNSGATGSSANISSSIQSIAIDKSKGEFSSDITIASNYAGDVSLNDLDMVLNDCQLVPGSFSSEPSVITLGTAGKSKKIKVSGSLVDHDCVPSSYSIKGEQTVTENGQSTKTPFSTKNTEIPSSLIDSEDVNNLTLELLDKQIDVNDSASLTKIRLRIIKGKLGIKEEKVKLVNTPSVGTIDKSESVSDSGGDVLFNYTPPTTMIDRNTTAKFCLEKDLSVCETVKIHLTKGVIIPPEELIDDINYFITFTPKNGLNNLDLGARNNAIVSLIDKDTNKSIPASRIKSITVKSRDTSVLKLTPEGGGTPVGNIIFGSARNDVTVLLTADNTNTGLVPIEVVVEYSNLSGGSITRGQLFSVAVLSGAPTAFSINSDGISYNFATKQFEHKFIIQATDANSNPISTSGVINVSAMASFAKDAAGREILYGRHSNGVSATLSPDGEHAQVDLAGLAPLNTTNIDENRAFVALFGNVNTYEANGKWNIKKGSLSGAGIKFTNNYGGEVYSNLGMAVGYNYRDKFCSSAYEESVVVVDSTDGKYTLDATGKAVVTLKHDPYMIGKRIMIMVNMTGLNPATGKLKRTGEVHETTLTYVEDLKGASFSIPKSTIDYPITIPGIITTGTADEYRLLNSTFSCKVDASDGVTNITFVEENDPASCNFGGAAYKRYKVSTSADGGTVTFSECTPNAEPVF